MRGRHGIAFRRHRGSEPPIKCVSLIVTPTVLLWRRRRSAVWFDLLTYRETAHFYAESGRALQA
jgi:hypothetical protein